MQRTGFQPADDVGRRGEDWKVDLVELPGETDETRVERDPASFVVGLQCLGVGSSGIGGDHQALESVGGGPGVAESLFLSILRVGEGGILGDPLAGNLGQVFLGFESRLGHLGFSLLVAGVIEDSGEDASGDHDEQPQRHEGCPDGDSASFRSR